MRCGKSSAETGSNSVTDVASPAGRCMSVFWQLAREKSLIPKCSEIRGIHPKFQRAFFKMTFASSSPAAPARQSGLCRPCQVCTNRCDIPES